MANILLGEELEMNGLSKKRFVLETMTCFALVVMVEILAIIFFEGLSGRIGDFFIMATIVVSDVWLIMMTKISHSNYIKNVRTNQECLLFY